VPRSAHSAILSMFEESTMDGPVSTGWPPRQVQPEPVDGEVALQVGLLVDEASATWKAPSAACEMSRVA
jgi:hypothetical protein